MTRPALPDAEQLLAALVDRGGRELPIAAQFVGAAVSLDPHQIIELKRDAQGRLSLALKRP